MNYAKKKLMLLGGLRYLLPVIEAAHNEGYYVITCDYLPENIAHKYSDEYCNVSIIDKEAVLDKAKELAIDGIMSFAVDPGVVTAAYVAEQMGLPFAGTYESVRILQNKDLFRQFLRDNGFNVPLSAGFTTFQDAYHHISQFQFPIIVKPVDSAGSKGVTRVDSPQKLEEAFSHALNNSISGRVIIEEFIEKDGCSSDSDCFTVDGKLKVVTFSAQLFDNEAANPYTPSAYSWPSTFSVEQEEYLTSEIQRLIDLLGLKNGIYNIETRVGKNGKPYIMEISPRGGGNRLAEMVRYGTGIDMITAAVRAAVGDSITVFSPINFKDHLIEVILHAEKNGIFKSLEITPQYKDYALETDLWVNPGDKIKCFNGANDAIGTLVMHFPVANLAQAALSDISSWCKVNVE